MKGPLGFSLSVAVIMLALGGCVKPYQPSVQKGDNSFLVVDGTVAPDTGTVIRLSRTRNLSDTAPAIPETNAQVLVEDESGGVYNLQAAAPGEYHLGTAALIAGSKYRLSVITSNGKQYRSDFVEIKAAPAIDSVTWSQDDDIFIYVSTHDPSESTRYYRWEFVETSNYSTPFDSFLDYRDGQVIFLEPEQTRTTCYRTFYSTNILLGSSAALSSDVIARQLINRIPNDNSKIADRYSILVKQYALSAEAYNYWNILRQNSEETGGIFDPQPSQLRGNIHCIDAPDEPVIGFLSASSVQSKRIFIKNNELRDRKELSYSALCKETLISRDSAAYYLNDGSYLPAYYISNGPLAIAPKFCVDCRLAGGVTTKPDFW